MARKKKKDRSEEAEVPISAMIDVVFLLLIYFIWTAKEVVDEAWVSVNLPGPPPEKPEEEPPPTVDVFVMSDNFRGPKNYVYQGTPRDLGEMESILMGIGGAMGEEVVINIKVSTEARHEKLVLILDRMNKAGLAKFNIHTLKGPLSK